MAFHGAIAQDDATKETQNADLKNTTVVDTTPKLGPSPDAHTTYVFPTAINSRQFEAGKSIPVAIGFSNKGASNFNVTRVFGSLMHPQDHRYYIQNFTRQANSVVVKPGEQHTFVYSFTPDSFLESRDIGFSGQFFYSDLEGNNYTSYWYNSTISLIEVQEPLDFQTLFTYVGLAGVAGLVLFIIYKSVSDKKARKPARRVETGTVQATVIDEDWLEGTHANMKAPKQRSPSPKGSRKVKST